MSDHTNPYEAPEEATPLAYIAPAVGAAALVTSPILSFCCGCCGLFMGLPLPATAIVLGAMLLNSSEPDTRQRTMGQVAIALGCVALLLVVVGSCMSLALGMGNGILQAATQNMN